MGGRIEEVEKSIFNHSVRLVGKKEHRTLMQHEYDQLTWYVLNNADEAENFVA